MKETMKNERGLSLVEVTIMLLVLMVLTGVLAPSILDFVNDAKWVRVKEDCEAIGLTVARLTRDVGSCLKFDGNGACTTSNRADLLYSEGPDVQPSMLEGDATVDFTSTQTASASLNWDDDDTRGDTMLRQFVENGSGPNYPTPIELSASSGGGPQFNLGWRGAYLSPQIGPDPWGRRYLVNSVFLSVATDATEGSGEGQRSGGWSQDVLCISAGPNGLYETAFGGNAFGGTNRRGDDFVFIISGDSR